MKVARKSILIIALLAVSSPSLRAQVAAVGTGELALSEYIPPTEPRSTLTPRYFLGSLIASGIGGGSIALTANPGGWTPAKRWHAYAGIAAGAAGVALAASELDSRGEQRTVAAVNGIVGTAALTLAVRALLTFGEAERRTAQRIAVVRLEPAYTMTTDARHGERPAAGAVLRLRF